MAQDNQRQGTMPASLQDTLSGVVSDISTVEQAMRKSSYEAMSNEQGHSQSLQDLLQGDQTHQLDTNVGVLGHNTNKGWTNGQSTRRESIFGDNGQPRSLFDDNGLGDSRGSTPQPCRRQRQSRSQEKSRSQTPNQNRNCTRKRIATNNALEVTTEHKTRRATPPFRPPNRDPTDQVATTTKQRGTRQQQLQ